MRSTRAKTKRGPSEKYAWGHSRGRRLLESIKVIPIPKHKERWEHVVVDGLPLKCTRTDCSWGNLQRNHGCKWKWDDGRRVDDKLRRVGTGTWCTVTHSHRIYNRHVTVIYRSYKVHQECPESIVYFGQSNHFGFVPQDNVRGGILYEMSNPLGPIFIDTVQTLRIKKTVK